MALRLMNRISYKGFMILVLSACTVTKHLPPGEKLYTGAKITLTDVSKITVRQKKVLNEDLEGLTRPRPNSRILGIPFKLAIYNMFRNKKPNSFFGKLRTSFGEPPVLLSSVDITANVKLLENHAQNKGYFHVKVTGDTVVKGKRGHAVYKVAVHEQYKINTVRFESDSSDLTNAISADAKHSLLKPGEPYDLDVIRAERTRVDEGLKERGFFYFSPEDILVKVDSTIGGGKVDMLVSIKPQTEEQARQAYRIDSVYIYSNYRINAANLDTSKANDQVYQGFHVIDRMHRFNPRMFPRLLRFKPNDIYNRKDHNTTLSRLINLNEFKYVKNRFELSPDSAKLNAYYYLTPLPKKSLRVEANAITKSNNLNGTQINFTWKNRNTFKQAEQLVISAYAATELQFAGAFQGYNTYRTGAEMDFSIPRFVVPFFYVNTTSAYVPRSIIQIGYDLLTRNKLYTVNSFRGQLGYKWKPTLYNSHEFNPVSINYVQPINVSAQYRDSLRKYPYLAHVVDSQFILGSTYQFNYNDMPNGLQKLNGFYFNGVADISGNIAGLLSGSKSTPGNPKRLFNAVFDQYFKLEADGRYYRRVGLKSTWASRLIVGYGYPYGNSFQLPYIKQFFVGGNNSLRGFRSRSVGPGIYHQVGTTFLADQTGDLKLEANTEFRPHISGPIYGAVFFDAGNIWLYNEDPYRPGSKFTSNFLNQLALDVGVGVRFDITLFVIRLDAGIPLRKPWEQNPWVMNQIKFGDQSWRRENIIFNLAIGYPF